MISSQVSGVTYFSHASAKLCPSPRGGFDRAAAPPQILENPVKPGLPLGFGSSVIYELFCNFSTVFGWRTFAIVWWLLVPWLFAWKIHYWFVI